MMPPLFYAFAAAMLLLMMSFSMMPLPPLSRCRCFATLIR